MYELIINELIMYMYVKLDQFDMEIIYVKYDHFGIECKTYSCTLQYM